MRYVLRAHSYQSCNTTEQASPPLRIGAAKRRDSTEQLSAVVPLLHPSTLWSTNTCEHPCVRPAHDAGSQPSPETNGVFGSGVWEGVTPWTARRGLAQAWRRHPPPLSRSNLHPLRPPTPSESIRPSACSISTACNNVRFASQQFATSASLLIPLRPQPMQKKSQGHRPINIEMVLCTFADDTASSRSEASLPGN